MKGVYKGPGDQVELDGLVVKRGETVELTSDQARRIRESAPDAEFEETHTRAAKAAGKDA